MWIWIQEYAPVLLNRIVLSRATTRLFAVPPQSFRCILNGMVSVVDDLQPSERHEKLKRLSRVQEKSRRSGGHF